jgi:HEAT repeat protein
MSRSRLIMSIGVAALSYLSSLAFSQSQPAGREWLEYGTAAYEIPPINPVNITPPRVVELLAQSLATKPPLPRRVELVHDLGESKLESAAPHIIGAMSDPDAAVRIEAARAAATLGSTSIQPGLLKLLSDEDVAVRCAAVRAGSTLRDASMVAKGLEDADESVFIAAAALTSTPGHDAQVAARRPKLSTAARLAAIRSLGRRGAVAHSAHVSAELVSPQLPLKIAAIEALARMKATSELDKVAALLDHKHPTVRRAAVTAMAALAPADRQIAVARQKLADPDLSVREQAARLLVGNPSSDMLPLLHEQLSAGYPPLREAARDALVAASSASNQAVIDLAVALLDHADARRREDGSFILGRLKSEAAYERHLALLADSDWLLVSQVADSLGRIRRPEAGSALEKIAARAKQDGGLVLSDAAQLQATANAFIACGKLRHKPILAVAKLIAPQKRDYAVAVRGPAIWAIGAAGEPQDKEMADILLSIARDNSPFESEEARFEAIKAIGNMDYQPAAESMRREAMESALPSLRWMSHTVADRLAGTTTPYTRPQIPVVADTSIQDLQP